MKINNIKVNESFDNRTVVNIDVTKEELGVVSDAFELLERKMQDGDDGLKIRWICDNNKSIVSLFESLYRMI